MLEEVKKLFQGQVEIGAVLIAGIFAQIIIVSAGLLKWRRFGYPVPRDPAGAPSIEARFVMFVLTGSFLSDLLDPIVRIVSVPEALISRVVGLTQAPMLVVALLIVAALATIPLLVFLAILPQYLPCRMPRKMACGAACMAAILWGYLATLAQPLDAGTVQFLYWRESLGALIVAATFALSLNNQQLRAHGHETP